ncbi:MAG TPA: 30S ribosomal protein S1, partial [Planctomycetota bacterium]|nr:30S ribosomal protein S1 [Planctomycetota bacterium]
MKALNPKVKELQMSRDELDKEVAAALGDEADKDIAALYDASVRDFDTGTILEGRVIQVIGDDVVVDVGYKSEGIVSLKEFDDPKALTEGSQIEVLLEAVEDDSGLIVLSKRKADRIRGWERIIADHKEGDGVTGRVMRKIKGGLLVDIGVPVFLPASQIDIRRPGDIAEYIGREVTCKILKIDEERRNIVVSRRKLIEEERAAMKEKLLKELQVGDMRKGVVKNIADFGAFVDLGGIDGLLHITDMSWGRVSHPSEVVALDEHIEVKILNIDYAQERIALGLKQKTASPWEQVEEKYPVGSRVRGEVVNIVNYGAFVKLEEGVEGLVHISEMSWTRRINHPSEVVAIGDIIEVVVLDINREKQEISLGMRQTEVNPWTLVKEKYPPGTVIEGRVRNLTNYGAFIEIEEGIDGLLHVS